jgi:general secretion pathway protein C
MAALQTLRSLSPAAPLAALQRVPWPLAVSAVLAALVGLQIAVRLADLYGAAERPPAASAAGSVQPAAARWDLQSLLDAHLFGEASSATVDGSQAPATSLALVLSGIIASDDPRQGYAIVGESAATARMHAVGSTLPGGARLHSVYPDRVVLDRNGSLESLALPKRPLAGLAPAPPAPAAAAPTAAPSGETQLEQMKQAMQRDPSALSEVIRAQQVLAAGRQRGFRVYPGNNPRAFSRLGLRPGDLITAVNGTPLDDPARGEEIMRTLGSAAQARVTVVRNGRDTDVMLDLAAIAGELATPP